MADTMMKLSLKIYTILMKKKENILMKNEPMKKLMNDQ